jgi:hypothetical protein
MFQTSTTNGITRISAIPNGSGAGSIFTAYGATDPTNSGTLSFYQNASASAIIASITGTGTYTPLTFTTNGSERLRIFTSGGVSIGNTTDPGATNLSVTGNITGANLSGTNTGDQTNISGNAATATNLSGAAFSTGTPGYYKIRTSGLIIQWGSATLGANTSSSLQTFSIAFPTACFSVATGDQIGQTSGTNGWAASGGTYYSASQCNLWNTDDSSNTIYYIAIGY